MDYNSLLHAIPSSWKAIMNNLNVPKNTYLSKDEIALENNIHKIESLTNDTVYWHMLSKIIKQPTAIDRWISRFPFLHDKDFELFFFVTVHSASRYETPNFPV